MPFKFIPPPKCCRCNKSVYENEKVQAAGKIYHTHCFKCIICFKSLQLSNYLTNKENDVLCDRCYYANHGPEGFRTGGQGVNLKVNFKDEDQKTKKNQEKQKQQEELALKMDQLQKKKQQPTLPSRKPALTALKKEQEELKKKRYYSTIFSIYEILFIMWY